MGKVHIVPKAGGGFEVDKRQVYHSVYGSDHVGWINDYTAQVWVKFDSSQKPLLDPSGTAFGYVPLLPGQTLKYQTISPAKPGTPYPYTVYDVDPGAKGIKKPKSQRALLSSNADVILD